MRDNLGGNHLRPRTHLYRVVVVTAVGYTILILASGAAAGAAWLFERWAHS